MATSKKDAKRCGKRGSRNCPATIIESREVVDSTGRLRVKDIYEQSLSRSFIPAPVRASSDRRQELEKKFSDVYARQDRIKDTVKFLTGIPLDYVSPAEHSAEKKRRRELHELNRQKNLLKKQNWHREERIRLMAQFKSLPDPADKFYPVPRRITETKKDEEFRTIE